MKLKQYNLKWVGTFIYLLYLTAPLIGLIMTVVNSITFYAVVYPYIHKYVSWFSFPVFIICIVVVGLLLILGFFTFILKGYLEYLNKKTLTNHIDERLDRIEKKLGIDDEKIKK